MRSHRDAPKALQILNTDSEALGNQKIVQASSQVSYTAVPRGRTLRALGGPRRTFSILPVAKKTTPHLP